MSITNKTKFINFFKIKTYQTIKTNMSGTKVYISTAPLEPLHKMIIDDILGKIPIKWLQKPHTNIYTMFQNRNRSTGLHGNLL